MSDVLAEIPTSYIPNENLEANWYTNVLGTDVWKKECYIFLYIYDNHKIYRRDEVSLLRCTNAVFICRKNLG